MKANGTNYKKVDKLIKVFNHFFRDTVPKLSPEAVVVKREVDLSPG